MSLGQILRGDRLATSFYKLQFRVTEPLKSICKKKLTADDIRLFKDAVDRNYVFEMYIDDLPVVAPIGLKSGEERYLMNKLKFVMGFNQDAVVSVEIANQDASGMVDLKLLSPDMELEFYYEVQWDSRTTIMPEMRLVKQLTGHLGGSSSQSMDIHWLSIINSLVLVMLIVSLLLLIILRIVRSDLSRMLQLPEDELAPGEEETGWKLLHADVFRAPPHRMWFCASVGAGTQLLVVTLAVVLTGCMHTYLDRGKMVVIGSLVYTLGSFAAGYMSANFYRKLGGIKWAWNIVITALAFSGPAFLMWCVLNTIAFAHGSTAALPWYTVVTLVFWYLCATLPMTVIGGILGKRDGETAVDAGFAFPVKTNKLAREIPKGRWYNSFWFQTLVSGLLPFSAIYIEMHYVFLSVWGNRLYSLYGVLLLSILALFLVSSTIAVLMTYFSLNSEDHRWWWRSFFQGGGVALFFFLHCFYYFFAASKMAGMLQVSFYFGYSLVTAWALFLMMGAVTFFADFAFIYYIYTRTKAD
uniref:Transmembrane 9 superfamily member n=1 Tax=Chromera velia CCMP2878 TaxID=1169474 RepID=A0A0G4ICY1_9ALVE|eukprot:Cvel_2271.t1-p1 / transcript=Cvel_2271.t1 / gene=Cvel_2271 / organism=Chromera_velia_CCMP2878 / gene_product=Transmembrane 9 superfamily member 1, putative / transcript_product=Transmembrane 9 superfamily member 1, putative / location=Cvel_scaffold88:20046-29219(+) / protein_length=524 / sequence_SO=supercontig / SO=protein_coding / is_pseudo=false